MTLAVLFLAAALLLVPGERARRLTRLVDAGRLAAPSRPPTGATDVARPRSIDLAGVAAHLRQCEAELAAGVRDDDVLTRVATADLPSAVAAALVVAHDTGAPLRAVLAGVVSDVRGRLELSRQVDAALAGPRASARLLAALPALGLALGAAMGAAPLSVLTAPGVGRAALLLGVVFELGGVAWTRALVRRALRE